MTRGPALALAASGVDLEPLLARLATLTRSSGFRWGLGIALASFVLGTLLVPLLWIRMPPDYFVRPAVRPPAWVRAVRALVAVPLLLAGVVMLVLPGQGLLTIALGVALLEFDGKRRALERLLVGLRLLKLINALRRRFDRPPLELHG